jgi:N-ethylmaleimide reductase
VIAYGVPFIANPDLVERYKQDAPLNEADSKTFYGGTEKGYTDYPVITPN